MQIKYLHPDGSLKALSIALILLAFFATSRADVFSHPENVRIIELNLAGDASFLDLSASPNLEYVIAPNCNFTRVIFTASDTLINLVLSGNVLEVVPDLSDSKNITIVDFHRCFMTEALVDQILADLDAGESDSIYCDLTGNAAPSSTGLSHISAIENRGGTVLHD